MLKIEIDGEAMHLQTAGTVGGQIAELCRVISGYYSQLPPRAAACIQKISCREHERERGALVLYVCLHALRR